MSDAIGRIKQYINMRREQPLRSMSDSIHGIHFGTEWEAELRLSDIEELVEQLAQTHRKGWEQAKAEAKLLSFSCSCGKAIAGMKYKKGVRDDG